MRSWPPSVRAFALGTAAFVAAGFLPLGLAGAFLAWAIVAVSAWWYVREAAQKLAAAPDPIGSAIGRGALLGAAVDLTGAVVRFLIHRQSADSWALVAVAGTFFSGTLLGAFAGLIGGLQLPRCEPGTPRNASVRLTLLSIAVVVLSLIGTVAMYVVSMANAMSDTR